MGHEWRHAGVAGLFRASDEEIVAEAGRTGEVILTHDLDIGKILVFSGKTHPSAVIFRTASISADRLERRINDLWPQMQEPLASGAIALVEDAALRTRKLRP